jgi:hypothetical protein
MNAEQKKFLIDVFFSNTLAATVQHAHIYSQDSSEEKKEEFRKGLRKQLDKIAKTYAKENRVTDEAHIQQIEGLSNILSSAPANALKDGRFRIGCAQKALNLYLKYLWCIGEIGEPPHCPFDSQIIAKLPNCNGLCWTKLDCMDEYRALVKAAKSLANDISLATWELQEWDKGASDGENDTSLEKEGGHY